MSRRAERCPQSVHHKTASVRLRRDTYNAVVDILERNAESQVGARTFDEFLSNAVDREIERIRSAAEAVDRGVGEIGAGGEAFYRPRRR